VALSQLAEELADSWILPHPPDLPFIDQLISSDDMEFVELRHGKTGVIGQYTHRSPNRQSAAHGAVLLAHGDDA